MINRVITDLVKYMIRGEKIDEYIRVYLKCTKPYLYLH